MTDDPLPWKLARLRGQIADLGAVIDQLRLAGLDSAAARLLMSRRRAELEDLVRRQPPRRFDGEVPAEILPASKPPK